MDKELKNREHLSLSVEELRDIVYGDTNDYDIVQHEITGTFRHGNENTAVIQRISDGKYFKVCYRDSVKDTCDFRDMNYTEVYSEVFPVEKTITVYN
jgi:hypothetical protein